MKKNSCTPINPKKYINYGLKKIHTRTVDNENKFLLLENSPPLHNFSNGPSLNAYHYVVVKSLFIFLHSVKVQQHQGHRKLHHCHCDHHCSLRHSDFRCFYYWLHGSLLCEIRGKSFVKIGTPYHIDSRRLCLRKPINSRSIISL